MAWEMEWWEKVMVPMRRAWIAFIARVRTRENGSGLLKLHDDVQMCGYQDVQVMWEMLNRPEVAEISCRPKPKRPILRKLLFWSSGSHALDHV